MLLTVTRLITASLLVASAVAFATGATIERHTASSERHTASSDSHTAGSEWQTAQHQNAEGDTPGEGHPGTEQAGHHESAAAHTAEHSSEKLLGINPEATGPVLIAVALSLLLAALILTVGSPVLAVGVALMMLAFIALDIREVTHQLNESRSGLAALAASVALLHLLAGAAALLTTRRQPSTGTSRPSMPIS